MMQFERILRVSRDRIGVIIGTGGSQKRFIEDTFKVKITIQDNMIKIESSDDDSDPITALYYIRALALGFSPHTASELIDGRATLIELNLRDYVSTKNGLERVRSRLIGTRGSARKKIEQLTGAHVSIYGSHVSVIGQPESAKLSMDAIKDLILGAKHSNVFARLERYRRIMKKERMQLWENEL